MAWSDAARAAAIEARKRKRTLRVPIAPTNREELSYHLEVNNFRLRLVKGQLIGTKNRLREYVRAAKADYDPDYGLDRTASERKSMRAVLARVQKHLAETQGKTRRIKLGGALIPSDSRAVRMKDGK